MGNGFDSADATQFVSAAPVGHLDTTVLANCPAGELKIELQPNEPTPLRRFSPESFLNAGDFEHRFYSKFLELRWMILADVSFVWLSSCPSLRLRVLIGTLAFLTCDQQL